jgi:hypothetical protein
LIALLSTAAVAWAQIGGDSREKSEKVSDILAALQAEPGKRIADVGACEGHRPAFSVRNIDASHSRRGSKWDREREVS